MVVILSLGDDSCSDWRKAESHTVWNCIFLRTEDAESVFRYLLATYCGCFKEYRLRLHSLLDFYSFAIHFLRVLYILSTYSVKWTVGIFLPFFGASLALLIASILRCCNHVLDSFISGAVELLPGKSSPVLISWRCPSLFLAISTLEVFDGNQVSKFKNC